MSWHRRLRGKLAFRHTTKNKGLDRRTRLHLEELETRALLSASSAATTPLSTITAQTNSTIVTPAISPTFDGYTPQQMKTAYGVPSTINGKLAGTGETIAIVDAYNDPNIAKDLATFDAKYGLPTANLTVVNQNGSSTSLPANDSGWAIEESLDVEWAHAIAPGAKIVLVEANSSSLSDLLAAVNTATSKEGANVVSMSWGASEFPNETSYDKYFTAPGVTYVASAGDSSAYFGPEWPASSPNVLSVGGTTLNLTSSNTISSETAWSASFSWYYGLEGGGGGISSFESSPSFQSQNGISASGRTTPDVAWDADPNTGVSVYDSYGEPGWGYVGGTSAGAPAWAGIVAIADQQHIADGGKGSLSTTQVESTLYQAYSGKLGKGYASYFNDITRGSNGYPATSGYDLATGLGSPKVSALISLLANPSSVSSSLATTTTSSTTGGTTTPSTPQPTGNHPTEPRNVFGEYPAASASNGTSASSPALSTLNPLTLVEPSDPTISSASVFNNGSFLPLAVGAPSLPLSETAPISDSSFNASVPQNAILFGATGWNGPDLSWRLSSLGLPSNNSHESAGDLFGNPEDELVDPSTGNAIRFDENASGDAGSVLDLEVAPLVEGDSGEGGEGGDGGSGE